MRLVKGDEETMAAWVGKVKAFSFRVEDAGVDITDEDRKRENPVLVRPE
jgi:hypothetical protein